MAPGTKADARLLALQQIAGIDVQRLQTYTPPPRLPASAAVRQALEELMTTAFPRDDFIDGLLDQGRTEGEAKGEAKMLLRVLAARGLTVPSDLRERVLGCTDTSRLEAWADRAVSATSIADVFGD